MTETMSGRGKVPEKGRRLVKANLLYSPDEREVNYFIRISRVYGVRLAVSRFVMVIIRGMNLK